MKKFLAMTLALAMSLSLVACGGGEKSTPGSTGGSNPSSASQGGGSGSQGGGEVKGLTEAERSKEFVTVGTGPTSGIYFPIGGAFAEALKAYGYQTSAEATNATGANIQLMLDQDAEIAIAMQDAVMQAYTATGAYEGQAAATGLI